MQVGNLRHRITFQRKSVSSKNSSGDDVYTWDDIGGGLTRSASIKPIKGQETNEARSVQSQVLVSIVCRYDPEVAGVTHADRIINADDATRIYAIHAGPMDFEEAHRWVEFWCSEGLQDQN